MLAVEKTRHIDISLSQVRRNDDDDRIYADESKVFQSISLAPNDVLTIRRENMGLSIEELSLLSGISASDIACMENGSMIIDKQSAQKLSCVLDR